jgi:hypothetical protein
VAKRKKSEDAGILEECYNRGTLARYLGVAPSTIARWDAVREGPPGFLLGGQKLWYKRDVAKWLEQIRKNQQAKAVKPRRKGRPRKPL